MITSRVVWALLLTAALGCGDTSAEGGGGIGGAPGTGGAGGMGAGGGVGGVDPSVLPCALRAAVLSQPSNEACEEGCTRTTGSIGTNQYFVACVQNESLESEVAVFDATV